MQPDKIFITGNTIVDALQDITARLDSGQLQPSLSGSFPKLPAKFVLVTAHRRENHGQGLRDIFLAIRDLTCLAPDVDFIFPVHLNPEVQGPAHEILGNLPRVHLLPPIDYVSCVWLMKHCTSILTDSGGIQEEAPSLRKRVVVMRDVTERPEAVESGWAQLVGTDRDRIISAVLDTLHVPPHEVERAPSPFGDGTAARQIADILAAQQNLVQDHMSRKVTIVMYHYVRDLEHSRFPAIKGLSVERFCRQLDYIQAHFTPITVEDLIRALSPAKKELPAEPHPFDFRRWLQRSLCKCLPSAGCEGHSRLLLSACTSGP